MGQPLKRTKGYLSCHRVSYLALIPVELIALFKGKTVWKCGKKCQGISDNANRGLGSRAQAEGLNFEPEMGFIFQSWR